MNARFGFPKDARVSTRDLTIDPKTKIITDENFQSLPEPYRVARYGYSPNKVVLTFDDGPDPEWTPAILAILKDKKVPATFFMIGSAMEANPGLVQQVLAVASHVGPPQFVLARQRVQHDAHLLMRYPA